MLCADRSRGKIGGSTRPSTRLNGEKQSFISSYSLRLPYGPLPPSLLHRPSLSLSLPDTAFPRINNSAQRNTSRKTLFNLDENENACILQPPVHTTRFSTRAGVTLSMKHRPIITQQTSFHRAIHTSYRIFSPPTYSRSLLPSRQIPSPRFDAFFSASAKSKGRVKGENV